VHEVLRAPGAPLDLRTRKHMQHRLGADFSGVRVHTDARAAASARAVGAHAYTVGSSIVFDRGRYRPRQAQGLELITHELVHTLQQAAVSPADGRALKIDAGGSADEEEARRIAARGSRVLQRPDRLDGGPHAGLGERLAVRRATGVRLARDPAAAPQALPAGGPVTPTALLARARSKDKPGFMQDIRGLAGKSAGDAGLRGAVQTLRNERTLTDGETLRAVALLELGEESGWPAVVTRFALGVDGGRFTLGGALPPAGADALLQYCVERAGAAAEGGLARAGAPAGGVAAVKRDYRIRFDARWELPRFAAKPTVFDATLSSKGPRNARARAIFLELYGTEPSLAQAYDRNWGGVRELCDTYTHPEGANVIASPRIQRLRALFDGAQIVANGTASLGYKTLMAKVVPVAQTLDATDRAYIESSRAWRGIIERKLRGTTNAITQVLFESVKATILSSRPPAAPVGVPAAPPRVPAGPAGAPAGPAGVPAGPAGVPAAPPPGGVPAVAPTPLQRAFLAGITLAGPATPVTSNTAVQQLDYQIRSRIPNPALDVRRHVTLEPASNVVGGQDDEQPWPAAATASDHKATIEVDSGAAPHTDFTARLRMEGLPAQVSAERSVVTRVIDNRRQWFAANIDAGLLYGQENRLVRWAPGLAMNYFGGQMPIMTQPRLPAPNPGLTVLMRGHLKRGANTLAEYAPVQFGRGRDRQLGSTIVRPPQPPPAVPDHLELTVEFHTSAAMTGAPLKTISQPFDVGPALPVAAGADARIVAADTAELNLPRAKAGSLRNHLATFKAATNEQRMLGAIESGTLKVQATIVRSDSAQFIAGPPVRGNPATEVAYAIGAVSDARTLVGQPYAVGWRTSSFPDHVFLNLTPNTHQPATKRAIADITPFLLHEGIHALDRGRPAADVFARYQKEFRAYWVQGLAAGLSAAFAADLPEKIGPRSPRANAIFKHVYDSPTYEWVKPAYDHNVAGFRERVDAYLYPDAVNLLLSANLAAVRAAIEGFKGADFPATRASIQAKYALCDAAERREIAGNRVWRDLVEEKFKGSSPAAGGGAAIPRASQVKGILGIP
jgi:hypothetical protein